MITRLTLAAIVNFVCVQSLKILIISPSISRSHILFTQRLAQTLTQSLNHTVFIWSIRSDDTFDEAGDGTVDEFK